MDDMRVAKLESMVEELNKALESPHSLLRNITINWTKIDYTSPLSLIFQPDTINSYATTILRKHLLQVSVSGNDYWHSKYKEGFQPNDPKRIQAAKDLVKGLKENRRIRYKFFFWAMMILAVDDSNQEEHLTLICEFARMTHVSDDELMDILHVVKVVFREDSKNYTWKSSSTHNIFADVLELY